MGKKRELKNRVRLLESEVAFVRSVNEHMIGQSELAAIHLAYMEQLDQQSVTIEDLLRERHPLVQYQFTELTFV